MSMRAADRSAQLHIMGGMGNMLPYLVLTLDGSSGSSGSTRKAGSKQAQWEINRVTVTPLTM